jgi:hypothetical protein
MEILETKFKRDRFYVTYKDDKGKQHTEPRATYVWLKTNPAFPYIPKGYVIHHLDADKTNDDPSNLSLMQRFHHIAHHWKGKIVDGKMNFGDDIALYCPTKRPVKYKPPTGKRYCIMFSEKNLHGKSIKRRVWRRNGKPMFTEEDAEKLIDEIWNYQLTPKQESCGRVGG